MTENIWLVRFRLLRKAGLSPYQAKVVFVMLDEARAFGSTRITDSARADMRRAYEGWTP